MLKSVRGNSEISVSDFTAGANLTTGMGVVITNAAAKTMGLPAASTDSNFYVVDKERIPEGIDTAYAQLPDSHTAFNTVANGTKFKAVKFPAAHVFATDQIANVAAFVNTQYVALDANGKFAASANATKLENTKQTTMVGGTTLYQIMVLD